MLVKDVYQFMNSIAPFSTAEAWDNCGLLMGSAYAKVDKIMLALDVTQKVANQAINEGVDLIITHHPVIFTPLKNIDYHSAVAKLVAAGISVISSHTCFDSAKGGMNDILCEKLELENIRTITTDEGFTFRIGSVKSITSVEAFAKHTAEVLDSKCVCCSLKENTVKSVAVCSGAGSSVCDLLPVLSVDVFVTGEIKYNNVIELSEKNIAVISAGHFETEQIFKEALKNKLNEKFSDIEVLLAEENAYLTGV